MDAPLVEALAPFAHSVHLKDQGLAEYEDGFLLADITLGRGAFDLKRMVESASIFGVSTTSSP